MSRMGELSSAPRSQSVREEGGKVYRSISTCRS